MIGLLTTGFFIGILLVFYTDLNVKLDVLKFIIPLLIFSLAIINILMSGNTFKGTISFFSVVLFGFFNGLGSSTDLEQLVSRHEAILTPILEVVFGFGAAVSVLVLVLMLLNLFLQKIIPVAKVKWILGTSILVFCIAIPMLIKQIFL